MFRGNKITKVDLANGLSNLDNKLDIIMSHVLSETFTGCCNCKAKESQMYAELKDYVTNKFDELAENITLQIKGTENGFSANVNTTFQTYKAELLGSLESLLKEMSNMRAGSGVLEEEIQKYESQIDNLQNKIEKTLDVLNDVLERSDS